MPLATKNLAPTVSRETRFLGNGLFAHRIPGFKDASIGSECLTPLVLTPW